METGKLNNRQNYEINQPKWELQYDKLCNGKLKPITGGHALRLSGIVSLKTYPNEVEIEEEPTFSGFNGKVSFNKEPLTLIVDPFKATFDIIAFNLNKELMNEALKQFDENGWLYDFKQYLLDHNMEKFVSEDKYTPVGYALLKENGWEVLLPDKNFHSDYHSTPVKPPFQY